MTRDSAHERRLNPRRKVFLAARVRSAAIEADVRLVDISTAGAGGASMWVFREGEEVALIRGDQNVEARVIWASDAGRFGLTFANDVDEAALTQPLRAAP